MSPLDIYIGWDTRETLAYEVARFSMERRSSVPLNVHSLKRSALAHRGIYTRAWKEVKGQWIDQRDKKPFSTEFAFTRFLVPKLNDYKGWALFYEPDMLCLADVKELFDLADDKYAVMCVHHSHLPVEQIKMDGRLQQIYRRKNWSSLVLWNCGHPSNRDLTSEVVSTQDGGWLHAFEWLKDEEIGSLPEEWNWLEGWSRPKAQKIIHYTRGGPWFANYQDVEHADLWRQERELMESLRKSA